MRVSVDSGIVQAMTVLQPECVLSGFSFATVAVAMP